MNNRKFLCVILVVLILVSSCICHAEPANAELSEFNGYSADTIMQGIYAANNLYTVFENHGNLRAENTCYREDNSVVYSKIIETSNDSTGSYVRIRHASDSFVGEMEGSSEAGYIACRWEDGTTEASVSYPGEFVPLIQQTYLEPYSSVKFDAITMSIQDDVLVVSADMRYNNVSTAHKMTYYVDPADLHLISISDEYSSVAGYSFNQTLFSYDQEKILEDCTVLDDVMNAEDARNLSIVYIAPEFGFSQVKDYTISESVTTNLDSYGFFNLYTSSELTRDSEIENLDVEGDATVFAVITTYNLQEKELLASEDSTRIALSSAPISSAMQLVSPSTAPAETPVPSSTPVPTVTPVPAVTSAPEVTPVPVVTSAPEATPAPASTNNIIITKSPTQETINVGGTAYFNATADNYSNIVWYLIGPDGSNILASEAASAFDGLRVLGYNANTLVLENVPKSMDGWTAKCAFINTYGDSAYSDAASVVVNGTAPVVTPKPEATPVVIVPSSSSSLKSLAEQYYYEAVGNVAGRIASWGWNVHGVDNFSYDESQDIGSFSLNASYANRSATFYFKAYPVFKYYVPIGFDSVITGSDGTVYPLISKSFSSTTDSASCWASFGDGIVAITSAPDVESSTVDPEPPVVPESPLAEIYSLYEESGASESTPIVPEVTGFTPGQNLGSGSLSSYQSDLLVLNVSWSATAESSDTVLVTLNASLSSRSIYTNSCPLSMSVGGQEVSFYTNGFTYEDNDPHYTPLGSYSFRINATDSCSVPIVVFWNFRGTYGGNYIENLICMGDAYISA